MKKKLPINILIILLLCAVLSSCFNGANPPESSNVPEGTDAPASEEITEPEETDPEETEPEDTTPPPHSDHVYENGSCIECGASDKLSYKIDHERKVSMLVSANACKNERIVVAEYYKGYPVTEITQRAFNLCENAKEIVIPDTMVTLAEQTFANCKAELIILGNGIKELPYCGFMEAKKLKKVIVGNSLETVGNAAFMNCEALEEIELPDTVTVIGSNAFDNCRSLKFFRVPKGVTELRHSTFNLCFSMKEVVLHEGIKRFEFHCFRSCSALEKITDFPTEPDYVACDAFEDTPVPRTEYKNCFYIGSAANPYAVLMEYSAKDAESITLHPDTRIIVDKAFKEARFTSIDIPDKVTYIGHSAFEMCYNIKNITIPDSVTYLGERAFFHCTSLENVKLSNSISELVYASFSGCKKLNNLIIPDSVDTIGEKMFDKCESLAVLHIPSSVKNLNFSFSYTGIDEIHYSGTLDEWMKIQDNLKGYGGFTVYCKDGEKVY